MVGMVTPRYLGCLPVSSIAEAAGSMLTRHAYSEKRRCFSFWRPVKDYAELSQDELADRVVYLLSQTVNYCSKSPSAPTIPETNAKRVSIGEALIFELERWKTFLGPYFQPLPTAESSANSVFQPIWIHPPRFAV